MAAKKNAAKSKAQQRLWPKAKSVPKRAPERLALNDIAIVGGWNRVLGFSLEIKVQKTICVQLNHEIRWQLSKRRAHGTLEPPLVCLRWVVF